MKNTTVVVGGGIAGMVAALESARSGDAVVLLERTHQLGGRGRSEAPEGFALNLGPHAVYPRAFAILRELGLDGLEGGIPNKGLTMLLGDRVHPLPSDVFSLVGNPAFTTAGKWQLARRIASILTADADAHDDVSVAAWLDRAGLEPAVRAMMEALVRVTSYTNAPSRVSAGFAMRQFRGGLAGVRYLHGGWQTIVDSLFAAVTTAGVDVRLGRSLARIERDGGRVSAVHLDDGTRVPCDALVLTTTPKATLALLGDAAPQSLRSFAERAVPVRAACLDVALHRLPRRHPTLVLGIDRPLYSSVHSNVAERLAPEGGAVIHLARYLGPDEKVDAKAIRTELEDLLERSQPGWREVVAHTRFSPAFTVANALPEIALGGLAGRPTVDGTGIAGVVIAGDWVGPEGFLLDASLISARAAVAATAERSRHALAA